MTLQPLACLFFLGGAAVSLLPAAVLSARNVEVPFCYLCASSRQWTLTSAPLRDGQRIGLTAKRGGAVLARGSEGVLQLEGTHVTLSRNGRLTVTSAAKDSGPAFDLEVAIAGGNVPAEWQRLSLRPAPPVRPIAYYADFGDDLINIFGAGVGGQGDLLHHELRDPRDPSRPPRAASRDAAGRLRYDQAGFDQYFRRLQCQGIASLILWLFPFPFLTDPSVYAAEDWNRYHRQVDAITGSQDLRRMVEQSQGHVAWGWLRDLFAFRADRQAHRALAGSAAAHGIALAVSYRPFEHAASKYYELPAFDEDGTFLWDFLPLASPAVNFRAAEMGFAHYREVLAKMNHPGAATVESLELPGAENVEAFLARYRSAGDNLRVLACDYSPIQSDSFILQRSRAGDFRLRRFADIRLAAGARRRVLTGFQVRQSGDRVILSGLRIPAAARYILLENPSGETPLRLRAHQPVSLRSQAAKPLGRTNVYWAFADESAPERKKTRIAGIAADAGFHSVFFASESSADLLANARHQELREAVTLVIQRGDLYSREMMDYRQPAARANAVRELRAILAYPAFREIYINTRSHTQLAGDLGDGGEGVLPKIAYRTRKKPVRHLGIDLGYAPRAAAQDPVLQRLAAEPLGIQSITDWQPGEWAGACQDSTCGFPWRYARNREIAAGVRLLLQDLSTAFPRHRLRVVLPERRSVAEDLAEAIRSLPAAAVSYTASRNNHIPNIGEGMALLDLTGLPAEPVLLGTGPFVDPGILSRYLDQVLADLDARRGSAFRGPLALMYEGQWTLSNDAGRQAREPRVCQMLTRPGQIAEVIVYEAADWIYRLPLDGWHFLDRCEEILKLNQ